MRIEKPLLSGQAQSLGLLLGIGVPEPLFL
jgi:hypothetical protein